MVASGPPPQPSNTGFQAQMMSMLTNPATSEVGGVTTSENSNPSPVTSISGGSSTANGATAASDFKYSTAAVASSSSISHVAGQDHVWPSTAAATGGSGLRPPTWPNNQFGGSTTSMTSGGHHSTKMDMGGWGTEGYHVDMFGQSLMPSYPAMAAAAAVAASANPQTNAQYKIRS